MAYDIDTFVNLHSRKVGQKHTDISQCEFEKAVVFDSVNDRACPVFVYELRGEPVAWYDDELEFGIVV
jgi:hypothetical protein